jgi:Flp pilus assembly protein protease CpaA
MTLKSLLTIFPNIIFMATSIPIILSDIKTKKIPNNILLVGTLLNFLIFIVMFFVQNLSLGFLSIFLSSFIASATVLLIYLGLPNSLGVTFNAN